MSSTALLRPETRLMRAKAGRMAAAPVNTALGAISLHFTDDLSDLKGLWSGLQALAPSTAFQTYDCAVAWTEKVLRPEGRDLIIVIGYGADNKPWFLWPFERARILGVPVLRWMAHNHANYNMGLFAPRAAETLTADDLSRLLREVARVTGAGAAVFDAQPVVWEGIANPFAKLHHQRSPNYGYAAKLGDFEKLFKRQFSKRSRHTLSRKERRLHEMGVVQYGWAQTREEKLEVLDAFFAQKATQFATLGINNIFAGDGAAFYRALALLDEGSPSRLRLGYVKLDGAILATFSGFAYHGRLCVALSSMTVGETHRQSPGALLVKHQIREACENGLSYYDFGAGWARHKDEWCDTVYDLFDSFIPFTAQGAMLTPLLSTSGRLKGAIKSNPKLWSFAQALRRRFRGQSA